MSAAVAEPIALENGRLQAELRGVPCATHRGRPEGNASGCNATCAPGGRAAPGRALARFRRPGNPVGRRPRRQHLVGEGQRQGRRFLAELRDVARGPHPAVLSAHGPAVALESLTARATVPVHLTLEMEGRVAESVEVAAYFVVSESLANIGKHVAPHRQP